jgi:alkylation response protein AidB-like acyl-CoA dehydrogenase
MDFSFTEEQTLLRNSVQKFVQNDYSFDARRAIIKSETGWKKENWAKIAEMGLLAAPFTEEQGGLGGGPIETMIIMEEFGRGLVVEPFLGTVVLGGGFLRHGGSKAQQEKYIPEIVEGKRTMAFAFAEPQGRYNLADLSVTAKKSGAGYTLNGHKAVVVGAPWADTLIVTARTAGGQRDAKGVSVFVVDKKAKGVSCRDYPTVDGLRASEVTFENVSVGADAVIGEVDR